MKHLLRKHMPLGRFLMIRPFAGANVAAFTVCVMQVFHVARTGNDGAFL